MMKERRVVTLPLPYAIYQGDNEITELSIVEPRFSDYKAYGFIANGENINMEAMFDLARKCTGSRHRRLTSWNLPKSRK